MHIMYMPCFIVQKLTNLWAQVDDLKSKSMNTMLFHRHFIAEMPENCMTLVKQVSRIILKISRIICKPISAYGRYF